MKKIVLMLPVLSHYNEDVFRNLMTSDCLEFKIVGGDNYENIKGLKGDEFKTLKQISIKIGSHRFYFMKGSLKYILKEKPDAIFSSGVDFHNIHIIIIFLIFKLIYQKKFYWWSHGTFGHQGKIGIILRKFFYLKSDGILTYSRKGKENLIQMGIDSEKIQVVNNSIVTRDYGFLNYNIFNKRHIDIIKILFCGRITAKARAENLIKALGRIKKMNSFNFKCIIIGDGDIKILKELVSELCLENNVELTGAKYGNELAQYFLESDLFVYPGGIGLSLLHSLSYGVPVITSSNTDLHMPEIELLIKDVTGDFFDDSISDLTEKIIKWEKKIRNSKDEIKSECVRVIKEYGYLPEIESSLILEYIKRDLK
jgi:glycosyltransferase involved in cell wall biosynthesis